MQPAAEDASKRKEAKTFHDRAVEVKDVRSRGTLQVARQAVDLA